MNSASNGMHLMLRHIGKSFSGVTALDDINLDVPRGSITAIVGASGSGKTTLLRIIAGSISADAGDVVLGDRVLASGHRMVPAHLRNIGYVAQDGALFPHLSVGANVAFGLDRKQFRTRSAIEARVGELLAMVSLDAKSAGRRPHELSGGQQQRIALARAMAREPEVMLLDEPFSALDAGLRMATRRAIGKVLADAGVTTVLVTHDQGEALSFADQVAVVRGGKLAQIGSPFVVYTRPSDRATAEFLGDAVILDAWLEGSLAMCSLGGIPVRRPPTQGKVQLMLRPEQIRIATHSPVKGVVIDCDFFGPESTVRIRLMPPPDLPLPDHRNPGGGEVITIRHWNSAIARPGMELCLRVVGEAVAFPVNGNGQA